jgi:hypothetical protein
LRNLPKIASFHKIMFSGNDFSCRTCYYSVFAKHQRDSQHAKIEIVCTIFVYLSREAKLQFIKTENVRLDSYFLYGQGPSFAQIKSYDTNIFVELIDLTVSLRKQGQKTNKIIQCFYHIDIHTRVTILIKKKIKFSSYIRKLRRIGCKVINDKRPPHKWGKICTFPHILRSPSSYMTSHPIPSEFPYI